MTHVSLRQIAEKAGCSRSTVSYALRNSPKISAELRDRVLHVASELGWVPDAELAKQMSLIRQTLIKDDLPHLAIVVNKAKRNLAVEHAPRRQLEGAYQYAQRMGYHVDIFNIDDSPLSAKRLRGILVTRGIQGIIFISGLRPEMPEEILDIGEDFACAVVAVRFPKEPYHALMNDYVGAGRMCLNQLTKLGYKRIGLVVPRGVDVPLGNGYSGGFACGYLDLPEEARIPILRIGQDETNIREKYFPELEAWLEEQKPDAVVSTDAYTLFHYRDNVLKEHRFDVFSADVDPDSPVGGINLRQRRLGHAAVDVVVAQLHRGEHGIPDVQKLVQVGAIWQPPQEQ